MLCSQVQALSGREQHHSYYHPRQQAWSHPRGGEVSCSQVQEQHHHLHSWTVSTHIPEEGCHAHKSRRCLVGSSTAYYPPRQ